jgi:hypothetical protein
VGVSMSKMRRSGAEPLEHLDEKQIGMFHSETAFLKMRCFASCRVARMLLTTTTDSPGN